MRENIFVYCQRFTISVPIPKEIANLCELKVNLTHHLARQTFAATVLLLNDVTFEIVSGLSGNFRTGITQEHYGQTLEEKVMEEMT